MKSKLLFKLLSAVVIIGVTYYTVLIYFPVYNIFSEATYTEPIPVPPVISQALQDLIDAQSRRYQDTNSNEESNIGLPFRLKIPKISVDASFEHLGLTSLGAMDVPKGPDNVGWFNLGPRPGEVGSSVIAGHYGWKDDIPAVFDKLYKLKIGDKIYVEDNAGATTTFVVTEIGIYSESGDATNVFSSNDGKAHLNLITCQGVWNVDLKSRPLRLVIFTDKVL